MKKIVFTALAMGMIVATPANALDHKTVIEHPAGSIEADYDGEIRIETKTLGSAKRVGRPNIRRCAYSVAVEVERMAQIGSDVQLRRSMVRDEVITGSLAGRCAIQARRINDIIETRRDDLQLALMALVAEDKQILLAEANIARPQASGD